MTVAKHLLVAGVVLALAAPGSAFADAKSAATVRGKLVQAQLPSGYENLGAKDDVYAAAVVESGGVVVRERGNKAGNTLGVQPMVNFPVDPTDPRICSAASARSAQNSQATLVSATVISGALKGDFARTVAKATK